MSEQDQRAMYALSGQIESLQQSVAELAHEVRQLRLSMGEAVAVRVVMSDAEKAESQAKFEAAMKSLYEFFNNHTYSTSPFDMMDTPLGPQQVKSVVTIPEPK